VRPGVPGAPVTVTVSARRGACAVVISTAHPIEISRRMTYTRRLFVVLQRSATTLSQLAPEAQLVLRSEPSQKGAIAGKREGME
jgi:hypothetical protein